MPPPSRRPLAAPPWRRPPKTRPPGRPLAVLLLPRPLARFLNREQARDLLRAPGVIAFAPPRLPYGVLGRLPGPIAGAVGSAQARRLDLPGELRVVVAFHPLQWPLARALLRRHPGAELWYARWDRYEAAYDAGPRTRALLARLHAAIVDRAALTFAVSDALADLERDHGRPAAVTPPAADEFPDPAVGPVAVSLGHLGRRTDWALLRGLAERMPDLVLLLIGERHDDESGDDPDFRACVAAPNLVWLGRREDEEAARLIALADVGIVPFARSAFNDTALPFRILKYARLGRRTVVPDLPGVRTWARAVVVAPDLDAWESALRAETGTRTRPDEELRAWAHAQTAEAANRPLWERLAALGIHPPGQDT